MARRRIPRGVTLIELLVAVALVAILAGVAYPAYTHHLVRSHRASAQTVLSDIAQRQQQYLMDNRAFATTPDPSAPDISQVTTVHAERTALLLGSERNGLSPGLLAAAGTRVRIPMHAGTDSLNVGAAAAIAMHALGPNGR